MWNYLTCDTVIITIVLALFTAIKPFVLDTSYQFVYCYDNHKSHVADVENVNLFVFKHYYRYVSYPILDRNTKRIYFYACN